MVDGDHLSVHLRTDALASHIGVNLESEVQGRGSRRQLHDFPLRSEDEHLGGEEIHLQRLHELVRVLQVLLPFQGLTEPGQFHIIPVRTSAGVSGFIFPVGSDTVFRHPVHLESPDLYFKWNTVFSQHSGVQ